jgi:4-alpha-glucanotransferase
MSHDSVSLPPFAPEYRASGLLLHVTSLPSAYGIGDVGPAALSWIDRLAESGQSWWQALPLGPTGYGNSPYQPLSSFAGNALLISPAWLIEDELLQPKDCEYHATDASAVDYDSVVPFKLGLLERAWVNFKAGARPDLRSAFEKFRHDQAHWLEDYSLFRALRARFDGADYHDWPADLVQRKGAALDQARLQLTDQMSEVSFAHFLLFRQGKRLRTHARARGVGLIGDLPFFVSADSSDVWANPELFLLDKTRRPRFVAGVPPDYFSATGQLWGNPVYDWDALRQSGYLWWIARLRSLLAHVDVIRLDHFRGFAAAWHVPAGAGSAQSGTWVPGPDADFFRVVQRELSTLPFIAEDLGMVTPDVYDLRDQFHLPGIRVLQFAFDGHSDNPYLPENFITNTVVYTGTHDNSTTRGWFEDLLDEQRKDFWKRLGRPNGGSDEAAPALIDLGWSSVAALAMAPLQDLLNLGREARMNVPGHAEGNWRWRATGQMLSSPAFEHLRDLTRSSRRTGVLEASLAGNGPAGPP